MLRLLSLALLTVVVLGGCRHYDAYPRLSDQGGLTPPDQWAAFGQEQAQSIAVGRAFAEAYTSGTPEARAGQIGQAADFARSLGLTVGRMDTLGYRLNVHFPSGWRRTVLPVDDGVAPSATAGVTTP